MAFNQPTVDFNDLIYNHMTDAEFDQWYAATVAARQTAIQAAIQSGSNNHAQPPMGNLQAFDPQLLTPQDNQRSLSDNNVNGQMYSSGPYVTDGLSVRADSGDSRPSQPTTDANLAYLPGVAGPNAPAAGYNGYDSSFMAANIQPTALNYQPWTGPQVSNALPYPQYIAGSGAPAFEPQATGLGAGGGIGQDALGTFSDYDPVEHQEIVDRIATLPEEAGAGAPALGQQPTGPVTGGGNRQARTGVMTLAEAEAWVAGVAQWNQDVIRPMRQQLARLKADHGATSEAAKAFEQEVKAAYKAYRSDYRNANQAHLRCLAREGLRVPPPSGRRKVDPRRDSAREY